MIGKSHLNFVLIVTISLYDENSSEFGCFDVLSAKCPQNLRNFFMILPLFLIKLQKIMISKTYLRYIWLLDTIIGSRESLTYDHIVRMWKGSPYTYMGGLPIRTFHEHRKDASSR